MLTEETNMDQFTNFWKLNYIDEYNFPEHLFTRMRNRWYQRCHKESHRGAPFPEDIAVKHARNIVAEEARRKIAEAHQHIEDLEGEISELTESLDDLE